MKNFGLPNIKDAIVVPLCTGMTLSLCLGALKPDWNDDAFINKRTVLVPQIDHNALLKALDLMGVKTKIVKGKVSGDAVRIPIEDIKSALRELGLDEDVSS